MPEASLTAAPPGAPARWLFVDGTLRAGARDDIAGGDWIAYWLRRQRERFS